jgi:VWFA-related protein
VQRARFSWARATVRAFLCAGWAAAAAYAQLPPAEPEAQLKLVDLNVVAFDNHNQPVTDLTAADFQVSDAGKPERIVFFRGNDAALLAGSQLGPREFTNRSGGQARHVTVILFDFLNDNMGASGAAEQQLVHALEKLESGDDLYLYFLTKEGRVFPVHPLPGAEGGIQPSEASPWTKQSKQLLDQAMKATAGLRQAGIDMVGQINLTFKALAAVAGQLSAIPGRKDLVWITHGVPISIRVAGGGFADFTPQIRRLSAVMDRANVAIYPVQQTPPGMTAGGGGGGEMRSGGGGGGSRGGRGAAAETSQDPGLGSEDTLKQFADLTGGRALESDVSGALRQAISDLRTNYQVAYQPPPDNWDGKYHKLRVTCSRKGVKVQSKTGYYAFAGAAADTQQAVEAVILNPADSAEIGIRLSGAPLAGDADAVRLSARINARDIALLREGDGYTGELQIALAGYLADGRAQVSPASPLHLHLTAAQHDEFLQGGIPYQQEVKLGTTLQKLRVVVLDERLGVAGSITMPVDQLRKP